jgi:hypothetical protein
MKTHIRGSFPTGTCLLSMLAYLRVKELKERITPHAHFFQLSPKGRKDGGKE